MKIKGTKISKRTLALAAVTLVLLFGGVAGTRAAAPAIQSQNYDAQFDLDHLQVHLLENGKDVCDGKNTLENKVSGTLLQYLGCTRGEDSIKPGEIEPGRVYREEIAAENGRDIDQYLRLSIRKYWKDADGKKDPTMDPKLIELTYNGKGYNTGAWQINDDETTTEQKTYYYSKLLTGKEKTEPVVNQLKVSGDIMDPKKYVKETTSDDGKTITYEYKYDGYIVCIEADVQALQTHNVNDAIKSLWGVQNVSVSGKTLTVK